MWALKNDFFHVASNLYILLLFIYHSAAQDVHFNVKHIVHYHFKENFKENASNVSTCIVMFAYDFIYLFFIRYFYQVKEVFFCSFLINVYIMNAC